MKDALVIFAKAPVPGRVKTRLGVHIGDDLAAELHAAFLADLAATVAGMAQSSGAESTGAVSPLLAFAGPPDHQGFQPLIDRAFRLVPQGEGDLGARMARVTRSCFEEGAERVVVIGSDSPTLPGSLLLEAFDRLERTDVVIGPSFDGGYYLLGIRQPEPQLFDQIAWSTDRVLAQTLAQAHGSARLSELLAFWYDVDDFDDLKFLRMHVLEHLCHDRSRDLPHNTMSLLRRLQAAGYFPGLE